MAIFDHNGQLVSNGRFSRPSPFAVPQVWTYSSDYQLLSKSYLFDRSDEAMKRSRHDAVMMLNDAHLQALCDEAAEAVLSLRWEIEPEDKRDPVQRAVAEGLTRIVRHIWKLRDAMRTLSRWKAWYGKAGLNCSWEWGTMNVPVPMPSGPTYLGSLPMVDQKCRVLKLKHHTPINGDKITFRHDGVPMLRIMPSHVGEFPKSLVTLSEVGPVLALEGGYRERVIVARHDPRDADYYDPQAAGGVMGYGIRGQVYWLWRLKMDCLTNGMEWLDRYGPGLPVVEVDQANANAADEARRLAEQMNRRSILVMPRSPDSRMSAGGVQFLDAPANGLGIITNIIAWAESHMERFIVGQSMSSGADNEGSLGGSGRAEFAADTKKQKISAYKTSLEDSMTGCEVEPSIVSIIKKHVYPWADFGTYFRLNLQDQDPAAVMNAVTQAASMGVTFQMDEVRSLTGLSKPTEGDEVVGGAMLQAMQQQQSGNEDGGEDEGDEGDESDGMFGDAADEDMNDEEIAGMFQ